MSRFITPQYGRLHRASGSWNGILLVWAMLGLDAVTVVAADRPAAFFHDGQAYDALGTHIGPMQISRQEKVESVHRLVGTRGTIIKTNGERAENAHIVRLVNDSDGNWDGIVVRTRGWESTVRLDDLSEINAGGQVVVLGSHPRTMYRLREYNAPRAWEAITKREEELDRTTQHLAEQSAALAVRVTELDERERRFNATNSAERARLEAERSELEKRATALLSAEETLRVREAAHRELIVLHDAETADLVRQREALDADRMRVDTQLAEVRRREGALSLRETAVSDTERDHRRLHGIVIRDKGTPVANCDVEIRRIADGAVERLRTNDQGRFTSGMWDAADYREHALAYRVTVPGHRTMRLLVGETLRLMIDD